MRNLAGLIAGIGGIAIASVPFLLVAGRWTMAIVAAALAAAALPLANAVEGLNPKDPK